MIMGFKWDGECCSDKESRFEAQHLTCMNEMTELSVYKERKILWKQEDTENMEDNMSRKL